MKFPISPRLRQIIHLRGFASCPRDPKVVSPVAPRGRCFVHLQRIPLSARSQRAGRKTEMYSLHVQHRDRLVREEHDRSVEALITTANASATLELKPAALAPATKKKDETSQ